MSLTHFFYEPFYSMSDFDRLFDEALVTRQSNGPDHDRQHARQGNYLRPKMDVREDQEKNLITATFELPGLKREDVHIDLHDSALTISGKTKIDETMEQDGYAVRERRFGRFSRSIPVPRGLKEEDIKASLEDGVLNITFPRSTPEDTPKKITVE
ncbi:HSP20-like chaperone [Peniophora sp. CONT]|nr:HSP20-like chaperone [Peniophora sp. CONT]